MAGTRSCCVYLCETTSCVVRFAHCVAHAPNAASVSSGRFSRVIWARAFASSSALVLPLLSLLSLLSLMLAAAARACALAAAFATAVVVGEAALRRTGDFERATVRRRGAGAGDFERTRLGAAGFGFGFVFSFFGATEDAWIGKIWPRGRAWKNGLSKATISDNFCNVWSGGLNFLNRRYSGSEVSIDPNGDVFPCCLKTKAPLGNLTEEPLEDIIDSLVGQPAFEAISMGHPERMGIVHGWDVETFLKKSETITVKGEPYRNLCIGCDRFHTEVLADMLEKARHQRLSARRL